MLETEIKNLAEEFKDYFIDIRRKIHMYPELGFKEFKTSNLIEEELFKMNLDKVKKVAGTGVIAELSGLRNNENKKCVLLRADIDALPIKEETDYSFKSVNEGAMHACGHDVHIAWALLTAKILSSLRSKFSGHIKFLFQPCEEGGGIKAVDKILKEGIMENPKVTASFAGHVWPDLKSGYIGIASKCAMACSTNFEIKIKGKGGHGATPEKTVDPISIAHQIYTSIEAIKTRRQSPIKPLVISICSINAGGDRYNIIPETCVMKGIIRSCDDKINDEVIETIKQISKSIAKVNNGEANVFSELSYYPVINDTNMIKLFSASCEKIINKENIKIIDKPAMTGENYSCFSRLVPSLYAYIGSYNKENKISEPLHSPRFNVDENIISVAASVFSKSIIDYLEEN